MLTGGTYWWHTSSHFKPYGSCNHVHSLTKYNFYVLWKTVQVSRAWCHYRFGWIFFIPHFIQSKNKGWTPWLFSRFKLFLLANFLWGVAECLLFVFYAFYSHFISLSIREQYIVSFHSVLLFLTLLSILGYILVSACIGL